MTFRQAGPRGRRARLLLSCSSKHIFSDVSYGSLVMKLTKIYLRGKEERQDK